MKKLLLISLLFISPLAAQAANNFCYAVPSQNVSNNPPNGIQIAVTLTYYGPDAGFYQDSTVVYAIVNPGDTLGTVASRLRTAIQNEAANVPNQTTGANGVTVPAGNILIPTFQFI